MNLILLMQIHHRLFTLLKQIYVSSLIFVFEIFKFYRNQTEYDYIK